MTAFTELFGLQTYIVNGVRSKKVGSRIALYQPLTLLDLVVYHKEHASINRISEIKCSEPFVSIPMRIEKSSIALFITEILNRTLREETEQPALFEFVYNSVLVLDRIEQNIDTFHIRFLLKLSRHLGFPPATYQELVGELAVHRNLTNMATHYDKLLNENYDYDIHLGSISRNELLHDVCRLYQLHVANMPFPASIRVLQEVFHQ